MFSCSVDLSSFRDKVRRTIDVLQTGVSVAPKLAARAGAKHAQFAGQFKDRTGNLRAGITAKPVYSGVRSARWEIFSKEKYSVYVENGTPPHIIRPKEQNGYSGPTRRGQTRRGDNDIGVGRGHALRWKVNGVSVFAKIVRHPGARPHPFMVFGKYKALEVLVHELRNTMTRAGRLWNV